MVGVVLPFSVVPSAGAVGGACDDMGAMIEDGVGASITAGVEVCPRASANQPWDLGKMKKGRGTGMRPEEEEEEQVVQVHKTLEQRVFVTKTKIFSIILLFTIES